MSAITPHDLKALETSASKKTRLAILIAFPLGILMLLVGGALNLYMCSRLSEMAGMSLSQTIEVWFGGFDVSKSYSGICLAALQKCGLSFFEFSIALISGIMFVGVRGTMNRNARILKFIKEQDAAAGDSHANS